MHKRYLTIVLATALLVGFMGFGPAHAQSQPTLSGSFSIGYPGYDEVTLVVGLIDAAPYFGKEPIRLPAKETQVIGTVSGIASRGSYRLTLPEVPQGTTFDLGTDVPAPISIFDVRLMSDVTKRGFMVENEDNIASSLRIDIEFRVAGGTLLIWTKDDSVKFPTGWGADEIPFTADDPRTPVEAGWSQVDLDSEPFAISPISGDLELDLITSELGDTVDYSDLSCKELIPTFLDRLVRVYPFSELYNLDWNSLYARLTPLAEKAQSPRDCELLIREIGNFIPDGHANFSLPSLANESAGSLGMLLTPLSDGQVSVYTLRENGPAANAGIKLGAIITAWNGKPIEEALKTVVLRSANASTPHALIRVKLNEITRDTLGSTVEVSFLNPGESQAQTATLTRDRPARIPGLPPTPDGVLPSGIGYIRVTSFIGVQNLEAFDRLIDTFIEQDVPAIIIDIRGNPGGFSQISDAMASRLFENPFVIGRQTTYDDRFVYQSQVEPRAPLYMGAVAVLVDWRSSSSADLFAYTIKSSGRGIIVGQTPSGGLAGTVSGGQYLLPFGAFIQVPTGNFVDENGKIVVEGEGVAPDVLVPITVESLISDDDLVLQEAEAALLETVKVR